MALITGTQKDDVLQGTVDKDTIKARGGADVLRGEDSNDTLQGGKGDDQLFGGEGNDKLVGAPGDDLLDGGEGNDNLNSGPGDDILDGGNGVDRLNARGGKDALDGGDGADRLLAGSGDDELLGGAGNDTMKGGRGADFLDGGEDDDEMDGGAGRDEMAGRAGADIMDGGYGHDIVLGNEGPDSIEGGFGDDILDGGADGDVLFGGPGNDTLDGGSEDDALTGGFGDDVIRGGEGDDVVFFVDVFENYEITQDNEETVVRHRSAAEVADPSLVCGEDLAACNDGTDRVSGVERIEFFDRTTNGDATNSSPLLGADRLVELPRNSQPVELKIEEPIDPDDDVLTITVDEVPDPALGSVHFDGRTIKSGEVIPKGELLRLEFVAVAGASGDAGRFSFSVDDGEGGTGDQTLSISLIAPPPGVVELAQLIGTDGFSMRGIARDDEAGISVAGAGDVNADGFDDVVVGARGADPAGLDRAGESYVVFGGAEVSSSALDLITLDGSDGFTLVGVGEKDRSGISVGGGGDTNADGRDDVLIGARGAAPGGPLSGETYVVHGPIGDVPVRLSLADLDGSDGFVMGGAAEDHFSGAVVADAGDVNGDGFDDVIIGASGGDGLLGPDPDGDPETDDGGLEGQAYVVFGGPGGPPALRSASDLDGSNGFVVYGVNRRDRAGSAVAGAGDVNADGFDDLIVGAPYADPNGGSSGASYVIFGGPEVGGSGVVELGGLNGADGFVLRGEANDDLSGWSVAGGGDVNGDGFGDVVVGAPGASQIGTESGVIYVVFGGDAVGASSVFSLGALDGANGFLVRGVDSFDNAGWAVAGAGDVDGDGLDDVLIGAPAGDPNGEDSGEAYVVFGFSDPTFHRIELFGLDGSEAVVVRGINAGDRTGVSVDGARDFNGDGFSDIVVGANLAAPDGVRAAGEAHVVFGSDSRGRVDVRGTTDGDELAGSEAADVIVAGRGDDEIDAGGGADVVYCGAGADSVVVADLGFRRIDGGSGFDTLELGGSGLHLDLTAQPRPDLRGIEHVHLADAGHSLSMDALAVSRLPSLLPRLQVTGEPGARLELIGSGWARDGQELVGDVTFDRYVNEPALVLVEAALGPPSPFDEVASIEAPRSQPITAGIPAPGWFPLPDLLLSFTLLAALVVRGVRCAANKS